MLSSILYNPSLDDLDATNMVTIQLKMHSSLTYTPFVLAYMKPVDTILTDYCLSFHLPELIKKYTPTTVNKGKISLLLFIHPR